MDVPPKDGISAPVGEPGMEKKEYKYEMGEGEESSLVVSAARSREWAENAEISRVCAQKHVVGFL